MPKIFLIKNRLLQQQQRLLESQKHVEIQSDEVDIGPSHHHHHDNGSHPKMLRHYPEPMSPVSDEPLSLVVHKGNTSFQSSSTYKNLLLHPNIYT